MKSVMSKVLSMTVMAFSSDVSGNIVRLSNLSCLHV